MRNAVRNITKYNDIVILDSLQFKYYLENGILKQELDKMNVVDRASSLERLILSYYYLFEADRIFQNDCPTDIEWDLAYKLKFSNLEVILKLFSIFNISEIVYAFGSKTELFIKLFKIEAWVKLIILKIKQNTSISSDTFKLHLLKAIIRYNLNSMLQFIDLDEVFPL